MKREELIEDLGRIVREYLPAGEGEILAAKINKDNVRYILIQLEDKAIGKISKEDEALLAEVAFYFS